MVGDWQHIEADGRMEALTAGGLFGKATSVSFMVDNLMCASDPYALVGVSQSFGLTPDIISGIVTDTSAGVELVKKLTGVPAVTISDRPSQLQLMEIVWKKLKS